MNPSVDALRATFGPAIGRALESCGDTIVFVGREALLDVMAWLRDTPQQTYDYLVDITAVEYRDRERPLEVVYNLRSLTRRADLRRILMWETYAEGYPLRKDFPLRGRFSRAEQVRQALAAHPEAHYSLEELSIADAYADLPGDMKERLRRGERGTLPDSE